MEPKKNPLLLILAKKKKEDDMGGDAAPDGDGVPPGLEDAMADWCDAYDAKDHMAMAKAFHDAFTICDGAPHEEGPHEGGEEDEEPEE
jgi:hypothetical protein